MLSDLDYQILLIHLLLLNHLQLNHEIDFIQDFIKINIKKANEVIFNIICSTKAFKILVSSAIFAGIQIFENF